MKIYGTNRPNIYSYYEQQQKIKQTQHKPSKDRLEISEAALKLQNHEQIKNDRKAYIKEIKQQINSGEYRINYEKTAKKLIDFFKK